MCEIKDSCDNDENCVLSVSNEIILEIGTQGTVSYDSISTGYYDHVAASCTEPDYKKVCCKHFQQDTDGTLLIKLNQTTQASIETPYYYQIAINEEIPYDPTAFPVNVSVIATPDKYPGLTIECFASNHCPGLCMFGIAGHQYGWVSNCSQSQTKLCCRYRDYS